FWEISLEGSSYTTRYGKIGTDGQTTSKNWGSPANAKREYEKIIAEKVKKGYQQIGGDDDEEAGGGGATNPELEKKIFADPDKIDSYQVYGDWLQGQGD